MMNDFDSYILVFDSLFDYVELLGTGVFTLTLIVMISRVHNWSIITYKTISHNRRVKRNESGGI